MHKTSFMASEKSALRQSKEYTNVRRDTQNTHTHTYTHTHTHTYNQTQASAVRCFCSYPQTTFVRPSPSRKQKDAESEQHTHTVHDTFCHRKMSLPEERDLLHLRQKTGRGCPLHTHTHAHTVNDISATAGNTLDCLTISFAHIHTFLTSH